MSEGLRTAQDYMDAAAAWRSHKTTYHRSRDIAYELGFRSDTEIGQAAIKIIELRLASILATETKRLPHG